MYIKTIITVWGFLGFIIFLFDKFFVWNKTESFLVEVSEKINSKLLFQLAFCIGCQRFWISVLLTGIISIFTGFHLWTITVPFVSFGLNYKSNN